MVRRGWLYGLWVAISVALPLQVFSIKLATGGLSLSIAIIVGLVILVHIICIPIWLRSQRQFLCRTEWARRNEIAPDGLTLFKWSRNSR